MASPVKTVVKDREDEPSHVYGALVGALSQGDAHTVHALLLETCLGAEGALDAGACVDVVDGHQHMAKGTYSSASLVFIGSSFFEAVKRVLEVN